MTLFIQNNCPLCKHLLADFNFNELDIFIETMDGESTDVVENIAWHTLIENSTPPLPLLILDDASTVLDITDIRRHLSARAKLIHPVRDIQHQHHPHSSASR